MASDPYGFLWGTPQRTPLMSNVLQMMDPMTFLAVMLPWQPMGCGECSEEVHPLTSDWIVQDANPCHVACSRCSLCTEKIGGQPPVTTFNGKKYHTACALGSESVIRTHFWELERLAIFRRWDKHGVG